MAVKDENVFNSCQCVHANDLVCAHFSTFIVKLVQNAPSSDVFKSGCAYAWMHKVHV